MEDILYRYNPWWEDKYVLEGMIERRNLLELMKKYFSLPQIVFLTGLRRIGKTTLLKLFIKYLIDKQGIDPKRVFYVSMDDYLLAKKSILELVEGFRGIHRIAFKEKVFLFFDEITYKDNFELQLKNLYDSHNVKIYVSSSSASAFKSKKAYLTGRNIIIEALPLDFEEYLEFRGIVISKADTQLAKRYFEDYLGIGGIPEYVLHRDMDCLRELVDDIIYRDIVAFYGVKNPNILKEFFVLLMERSGKQVSINKMANILNISPDTVKRYLQMFSDTYLIYLIPRCGKTNERILSPKKVYAPDLGIKTLFSGFRDKGSLFETYVYLKIKHYDPCYVYEKATEIDFLTKNNTLIEVKYGGEMTGKQFTLFNTFKADKRIIIRDIQDVDDYDYGSSRIMVHKIGFKDCNVFN
ncbi:MAG: ATP-binding protein [bacterium]